MTQIAIFASGSGTNAQRIIEYFKNSKNINISCVLTNNKNAFVIERCKNLNVKCLIFNKSEFYDEQYFSSLLKENGVDFIVLAGFLWLIPKYLIKNYKNKIINIHPALLPKYGGKGMYGENVHKAVIENNENESGITIHFVNENYDEGGIIFQAKCNIEINDSPEILAKKIHELEYLHFPLVIEKLLSK